MDFTNYRAWFLTAFCLLVVGLSQSIQAQSALLQFIMSTPTITAQEIRELLADEEQKDRFVIVDVRSESESGVSLIPGAITQAEFKRTEAEHQGKEVIAYCTIGVRSGKFVKQLARQGWKAWNYEGSIIDWCKNQLPLVSHDGSETRQVHTYSSRYTVPGDYEAIF